MAILNEFGNPYPTPYRHAHASDRNPTRGPVYPTRAEDIDRLITPTDLRVLRSLSSRLFTNLGICRDAILQKATYSIGQAWIPAYVGESDFSDGKQIATYMRKVWFPNCNVKGGVFGWQKTLELTSIAVDRDGDCFWLKIIGSDNFPRLQVVPAHRVGNGGDSGTVSSGPYKGLKISDGVIAYKSGRPAAYRVLTGERGETWEDVAAENVIHIFNPDFSEQYRGQPAFTHAIEDMISMVASTSDERLRQMIVSRMHLTIYNETGGPDLDDPMVSMVDSGITGQSNFLAQSAPGGIVYMTAGAGEKIEQVKHESPGDMWENFQNRMTRTSLASVWPYALVWQSTGQGTAERGEILKGRKYVTERQKMLTMPALQAFSWAYSVFQQNNRVPLLDHPLSWRFSIPPRLSVDDGRESKMEVEEWRAGLRNTDEITEARGITEEDFSRKRAWSIANRKIIARQVSEEASKTSGYEIVVDDREMAMLTPNEVSKSETLDASAESDPSGDPEPPPAAPTPPPAKK